jgi:hypothetical protein
MHLRVASGIVAMLGLTACNSQSAPVTSIPAPVQTAPASVGASDYGPVLGSDGRCTGTAPGTANAIEAGIAECDLVRLKGKPATDVLVGESGKGQREVQVLYSEPGGRELYFFVNNKLERIVKP